MSSPDARPGSSPGSMLRSRRRQGRWALCAAALLFATAVGTWQAEAVLQFRRPAVDEELTTGQRVVVEGVGYRFTRFTHGRSLPLKPSLREPGGSPVVQAPARAELVQVVLTLDVVDVGRDPSTIYCDVTLVDAGRRWRSDGDVDYRVAGPEATTCTGTDEAPPRVGIPYQVGTAFTVPADAVEGLTVRVRLSGGQLSRQLELRPR